jgi:hypothetical protein
MQCQTQSQELEKIRKQRLRDKCVFSVKRRKNEDVKKEAEKAKTKTNARAIDKLCGEASDELKEGNAKVVRDAYEKASKEREDASA